MIRMMVRAIEKQGETSGAVGATKFVDNASIAQKDTGFINVAAKYDIITGYPDGTLCNLRILQRIWPRLRCSCYGSW